MLIFSVLFQIDQMPEGPRVFFFSLIYQASEAEYLPSNAG